MALDPAKLAETFREEAHELVERMEHLLVDLERAPHDLETVNQIFRALHTLKGSGAMFGFSALSGFAHEFEALFDRMRKGELKADKAIIDLTLAACDHVALMLEPGAEVPPESTRPLVESLRNVGGAPSAPPTTSPAPAPGPASPGAPLEAAKTFLIHFIPKEDLFLRGSNPLALFEELRGLGDLQVFATPEVGPLDSFDPERCLTSWCLVLRTDRGEDAIRDAFIFVVDFCDLRIEAVDGELTSGDGVRRIGDILLERGHLTREALEEILRDRKRFGEIALEKGLVENAHLAQALTEQEALKAVHDRRREEQSHASIRVKSEKIDALVNLVGEIVTLHSRFHQTAARKADGDFRALSEALGRLSGDLRDTAMGMRMVPVEEMFRGFHRLVRDVSHEVGKDVNLVLRGAETELDKNVIDALKDPLMHILRNAVDHGIEDAPARAAAGKQAVGTVTLSAEYEGAHVLLSVEDDGGGLRPERILAKAVEKGLVKEGAELGEQEIIQLIFLPGFSTAAKATSVSGRGVGMDVVKKNVERLRGTVEVSSKAGLGTRMALRIPLTLAIIDGLLSRIGGDFYVLNLSAVDECVDLTPAILATGNGSEVVDLRGDMVPYIRLREHFAIAGNRPPIERMVVARIGGRRMGVVVDDVLGQHQTVIKSLGAAFGQTDEVAGATILGDGTVALILDVNAIARHAIAGERAKTPTQVLP
ncbi:MAG: chemotaxis protein CheA [Spirochaetes bacterium]|nr:chemotaxis protein CheA [Spirochaetota bacterium]